MAVDSLIIKLRTVPLGENSCKRNYFIDDKVSMEKFNTTDLHRFSWLEKLYMYVHKKTTVRSHSNK